MLSVRRLAPAVLVVSLLLAACQSPRQFGASSPQQVADAFVSEVVLPNDQQLVQNSKRLSAALDALATTPGADQLEAARKAWQQVRKTWETGESWAFGPAESGGFDGNLDEVAAEKLGDSLASRSKSDRESFYSDKTRADIVANLAGVSEALQRSGLIQLIASRDAQLARSLQGAMDEAEANARALPEQLNTAINDPAGRSKIEAVMANSERTVALLKQAAARLS